MVTVSGSASYDHEYYKENSAEFWGKGAEELGLKDKEVTKEAFDNLKEGKSPDGEKQLVQKNSQGEHRSGTDVTFSAPKSVSLLAQVDPSVREAHDEAVKEALKEVEKGMQTRDNGQKVDSGNMVAALFDHNTSRENDPQMHTHAHIFNATERSDGEWRAISNDNIYQNRGYHDAVYMNKLAEGLQERGYEIEVTDRSKGQFEVKGINENTIKEFSQRSEQIKDKMNEYKDKGQLQNASEQKQRNIACLDTRADKVKANPEELKKDWSERLGKHGQTFETLKESAIDARKEADQKKETTKAANRENGTPEKKVNTARKNILASIEAVTDQESVFKKEDVVKHSLKLGLGEHGMKDVEKAWQGAMKNQDVIRLDKNTYTTKEMQQAEKNVVKLVEDSKDKWNGFDKEKVDKFIQSKEEGQGWNYSKGQRDAVSMVLTSRDGVNLIQGDAGAGKTTAMESIKEYADKNGYEVRGLGFTGKAAVELEAVGIKSSTIDSWLGSKEVANSKAIYVMDESSMVGSKQAEKVLEKTTASGAKTVIMGDKKQFQSISAGKIFQELQNRTSVDKVEIKEVQRQKTEYMKETVKAISEKDTKKAFGILEKQGNVKEITDRTERLNAVKEDYLKSTQAGKETMVITGTNADRKELNGMIRDVLVENGKIEQGKSFNTMQSVNLDSKMAQYADSYKEGQIAIDKNGNKKDIVGINRDDNTISLKSYDAKTNKETVEKVNVRENGKDFKVYQKEERNFSEGDKVVFLKNDKKVGVTNGQTGIIKSVDEKKGDIKVDVKGREVTLNLSEKGSKQYQNVDHAYALTTYKSQGATVDKLIWDNNATNGKSNTNEFYVAVTRAKYDAVVYTNDKDKLQQQTKGEHKKSSTLDHNKIEKAEATLKDKKTTNEQKVETLKETFKDENKGIAKDINKTLNNEKLDSKEKVEKIDRAIKKENNPSVAKYITERVVEKAKEYGKKVIENTKKDFKQLGRDQLNKAVKDLTGKSLKEREWEKKATFKEKVMANLKKEGAGYLSHEGNKNYKGPTPKASKQQTQQRNNKQSKEQSKNNPQKNNQQSAGKGK